MVENQQNTIEEIMKDDESEFRLTKKLFKCVVMFPDRGTAGHENTVSSVLNQEPYGH